MRVTAGTAKGARLRTDAGARVRPTSNRVKEALFNSLAPRLAGARVLDLFAGAGGLGIEALSRGAGAAVFVERDPRLAAAIRDNLRAAGMADRAAVRRADAIAEIAALGRAGERFDLIVLDPPYGRDGPRRALREIARAAVLAPAGAAVAEGHWRDDPGEIAGLRRARSARYGETALWFYEAADPAEPGERPAAAGEAG